jgi:hypothetical protein
MVGLGGGEGGLKKALMLKNGCYIFVIVKWFLSDRGSDFALEPMNEAGS